MAQKIYDIIPVRKNNLKEEKPEREKEKLERMYSEEEKTNKENKTTFKKYIPFIHNYSINSNFIYNFQYEL
jgi:hypothetical protein